MYKSIQRVLSDEVLCLIKTFFIVFNLFFNGMTYSILGSVMLWIYRRS